MRHDRALREELSSPDEGPEPSRSRNNDALLDATLAANALYQDRELDACVEEATKCGVCAGKGGDYVDAGDGEQFFQPCKYCGRSGL